MSSQPGQAIDRADAAQIEAHLRACDERFVAGLVARVDLKDYARKLAVRATRFEAWVDGVLAGLVAAYFDAGRRTAFVTNVSTLPAWTGRGIASALLARCIEHARSEGMDVIRLEVSSDNDAARRLYERAGFRAIDAATANVTMRLQLKEAN